jgi:mevalonate pyrophosphate decarboxylase
VSRTGRGAGSAARASAGPVDVAKEPGYFEQSVEGVSSGEEAEDALADLEARPPDIEQ